MTKRKKKRPKKALKLRLLGLAVVIAAGVYWYHRQSPQRQAAIKTTAAKAKDVVVKTVSTVADKIRESGEGGGVATELLSGEKLPVYAGVPRAFDYPYEVKLLHNTGFVVG